MADFYSLLSRAIAGLSDNTPEARQAVYERARSVLLSQLRSYEPPLAEADIAHQRLSLEDVIRQVESEQSRVADSPWPDEAPAIAHPGSAAREEEAPSADQESVDGRRGRTQDARRDGDRPEPRSAAATDHGRRPRLGVRAEKTGGGARKAVLGGIAVVVIGAIAVVAFLNREPTPPAVILPTDQAQQESERKLTDRIGGEAPAGGQASQSSQPSQQSQAGKSDERGTGGQTGTPGQSRTQADGGTQTALAPAQQGVAAAQRAVLYEEVPGSPQQQQPLTFQGRAVWRVDSANVGQSQRLDTVVRADVEVPDAGLTLSFIIRRNTDTRLPASHTIEMTFGKMASGEGRVIKDIGLPQFKGEENARGTPIAGVPAPVADNFFLVGMSNLPADVPKNIDLLRSKNWIDIPILYDNKRRGVLAFEKGTAGDQAIANALNVWAQ